MDRCKLAPIASSRGSIVTFAVLEFGHAPLVVYVTTYVPGVDALTSIVPVDAFIDSPAVLEKVPPANPVIVAVVPIILFEASLHSTVQLELEIQVLLTVTLPSHALTQLSFVAVRVIGSAGPSLTVVLTVSTQPFTSSRAAK